MTPISLQERERILDALRESVQAQVYDVWCRTLTFEGDPDAGITIPLPNPYYKELMERELRLPLQEAIQKVYGRCPLIVFAVRGSPAPAEAPAPKTPTTTPAPIAVSPQGLRLNPTLTFDRFIVGPSNRYAHAAALAVAHQPGRLYNPLFIHGAVGLGKTHLLQAVCQELMRQGPAWKIYFLPCESFVNEYILAVQKNTLPTFRAKYRSADALFVDDIHFLAGKEASQDEFFHTYNALQGSGKQIVLASDAQPGEIRLIHEQLISRFSSGLVVRVERPEFETRLALLDARARERGRALPEEVLHFLAQHIRTNFRDLEGAVNKMIAFSGVSGAPLDVPLAQAVIRDLAQGPPAPVGIPEIQAAVCEHFKIDMADLAARRWTKSTSLPRQIAIYLARRHTPCSLKEIGAFFGGKDHATVSYAIKRIQERLSRDGNLAAQLEALSRKLTARP